MTWAFNYVSTMLGALGAYWVEIFGAINGATALITSVFGMWCVYRFLLMPLFGGAAGSDSVRKSASKKSKSTKGG